MSTVIDKITSPQQPAENIRETERVCESRKAEEQPKTGGREIEEKTSLSKPRYDEYIPEKKADKTKGSKKRVPDEKKSEGRYKGSTDKVDREIEKLRKEKEKLKAQLSIEKDDTKAAEFERRLAQVERELKQKDNDAYRRQHMEVVKM